MTARYFGLVPAAGSGSRFGADVPKQYSPLAGKPMLYHSIARLLGTPEVEIAFVVLAPGDTEFRNSVSPGASTTKAISTSGVPSRRAIEWYSIGLPASGEYCFGTSAPKREPEPAAGTRPKYLAVIDQVTE